ncbi:hypothetical protein QYE76_022463 [Lolium multiflorum]|uniref:Uncharacterized protein n=1 Tax=Lolium multiflorum TaxID=4521 RepID=A0AAD8RAC6_LOLMU|nr:hypothetical protein QYE76_022463 [Lolium multiflorum]
MSDYFDTSSDSDDGSVENFGISVATQPLPTPQLQALRIRDHVLVTLDYEKDNYGLWSLQFLTALSNHTLDSGDRRDPGRHRPLPMALSRAIFRDNRDTCATFLRDEFHGFNQGDLSVVDYTSKMKHMADTLGDLGSRVKDRELVHNVRVALTNASSTLSLT